MKGCFSCAYAPLFNTRKRSAFCRRCELKARVAVIVSSSQTKQQVSVSSWCEMMHKTIGKK